MLKLIAIGTYMYKGILIKLLYFNLEYGLHVLKAPKENTVNPIWSSFKISNNQKFKEYKVRAL